MKSTQKHSMRKSIILLSAALAILAAAKLVAHDRETAVPGSNIWNQAQEPTNWWNEIKQAHGHVGPWNVIGWRMGKAALRELNATWGQHELDIVCHIPLKTPYSCIADGLVVGTGNSIGRLDIRLAEALALADAHVSVRRKDGKGPVLMLKPNEKYLEKIRKAPDGELGLLARECGEVSEKALFAVERVQLSRDSAD
jgi:formylmethanofuran dehydrogenase subunit E